MSFLVFGGRQGLGLRMQTISIPIASCRDAMACLGGNRQKLVSRHPMHDAPKLPKKKKLVASLQICPCRISFVLK